MLKVIMKSLEDIPEAYRELYAEQADGTYKLTGVEGVKDQGDIDRLSKALNSEKELHKATKEKLRVWADMDPEEVHAKLDRFDELEAAANDKLDDTKIQELAEKRAASLKAPLERELKKVKSELAANGEELETLRTEKRARVIEDAVRSAVTGHKGGKLVDTAMEDVLLLANSHFTVDESGNVIVRDDVRGATPGIDPSLWISEMQERRPHWFPPSQGGGASGGGGKLLPNGEPNPWSRENWNITKQAQFRKQYGDEKAGQLATMAGSKLGSYSPPPEKK